MNKMNNQVDVYIQSKSGNFNARTKRDQHEFLHDMLKRFRAAGGYYAPSNGQYETIFIPFEEIEYLAEEWK